MAIGDKAIVRVLDDAGREQWRGSLVQFERDNQFSDEEAVFFRTALHRSGRWVTGGGAAPVYVVEIVSAGYIVTAISAKGRRCFRSASPIASSIQMAMAVTDGAVVLMIGPDGEYRSVLAPTAPDRLALPHIA